MTETAQRRTETGALFDNDSFRRGGSQPVFTGPVTLSRAFVAELLAQMDASGADTTNVRLAAWWRVTGDGSRYQALKLSLPQPRQEAAAVPTDHDPETGEVREAA